VLIVRSNPGRVASELDSGVVACPSCGGFLGVRQRVAPAF